MAGGNLSNMQKKKEFKGCWLQVEIRVICRRRKSLKEAAGGCPEQSGAAAESPSARNQLLVDSASSCQGMCGIVFWSSMPRCGVVWCCVAWYGIVWYSMVRCGKVWCDMLWLGMVGFHLPTNCQSEQ